MCCIDQNNNLNSTSLKNETQKNDQIYIFNTHSKCSTSVVCFLLY